MVYLISYFIEGANGVAIKNKIDEVKDRWPENHIEIDNRTIAVYEENINIAGVAALAGIDKHGKIVGIVFPMKEYRSFMNDDAIKWIRKWMGS